LGKDITVPRTVIAAGAIAIVVLVLLVALALFSARRSQRSIGISSFEVRLAP
jgi:hypothetical protein